jgi:hypothetical protein
MQKKLYKIIYPELDFDLLDNKQFICFFNEIEEIKDVIKSIGVFIIEIENGENQ